MMSEDQLQPRDRNRIHGVTEKSRLLTYLSCTIMLVFQKAIVHCIMLLLLTCSYLFKCREKIIWACSGMKTICTWCWIFTKNYTNWFNLGCTLIPSPTLRLVTLRPIHFVPFTASPFILSHNQFVPFISLPVFSSQTHFSLLLLTWSANFDKKQQKKKKHSHWDLFYHVTLFFFTI
jgi:hypothetical protein